MNNLIKKISYEFVYGGHLLSLGAASIVWSVIILYGFDTDFTIVLQAYFISQLVYKFDHLRDANSLNKGTNVERNKYLQITRKYQQITYLMYLALFVIVSYYSSFNTTILSVLIILSGIFYTLKGKKLMNVVVGLKSIYISLFWSMLTLLVPLHFSIQIFDIYLLTIILFIFIRWIINSAFFDLKDIEEDKIYGLKTIPAVLGKKSSLVFLHVVNLLSGIIILISVILNIMPNFALVLLIFPLYSFYYLNKAHELEDDELRKLSYIMVDGEYILWPLSINIAKYFIN